MAAGVRKPVVAVTKKDEQIAGLVARTSHRKLGAWAADCAERVLPHFEQRQPGDTRPRKAIETLRAWIETGEFSIAAICGASLAVHAVARGVEEYSPARSAARAASQAVATAHLPRYSLGATFYAATAVRDAADASTSEAAALKECEWKYRRLILIRRPHIQLNNS